MATNWNDFTPVEPTAPKGGKVDWSQFEPIKPSDDGQMVSGFKRAFQEVPGLAAGVGAYAADVVGANDTRDALLGYAKRKSDEVAQQHANDAQSITDAWDGKVGWLDFLANASGYVAGQALQSIATGGLGALGARMVAKAGAKELAEAAAAKAIAAGATEQAAQAAARDAVVGSINKAMQRGGIAGAMGHNFGMELGSIYPDAVEQAEKDGRTLDGGDKFRVLAAASLAAGVDTAGEAIMASRLLKGSGSQSGTFLGRAAREVPAGMAREAATEAVQTGIEQYGAAKPLDVREIVDAAGVGAVGGGLGGAVSARKTSAPTPRDVLAAPTVDDAIDKAAEAVSAPALQLAPRAAVQDGIPFEADPRFANVPTFGNGAAPKTPVFGSKQAADIHIGENDLLGRFEPVQVGDAWTIRQTDAAATAQSIQTLTNWMQRAQAMPKAKADDMVTQGREQLGKDLVAVPHTNGQGYTVVPRQWVTPDALKAITPERIPVGEVSEALPVPDATELEPIPTGEASELLPTGDAAELPKKIAAGKATEAAVETIHADDLLTQDQVPYGSRTAANLRARREGLGLEHVVEIPGAGWVIRPDLSVTARQSVPAAPIQAQPNGTRGTNAGDVVKPVPAVPNVPVEPSRPVEATGVSNGQEVQGRRQAEVSPAAGETPAAAGAADGGMVKTKTAFGMTTYVRQSDLDGGRDLIPMFTADGKRNGRIHRENLDPTGEKRAAAAKEDADNPMFNVITRKGGAAFATQEAAARELSLRGMAETHEVAPAAVVSSGADGFVIRKKPANETASADKRAAVKDALARRKRTLQEQVERPAKDDGIVATAGAEEPKGERKFYVTMVRGDRVARLAGPFDTKDDADAALPRARDEANQVDPRSAFDAFGVSAITSENHKPGTLNERLGIGAKPAGSTLAQEPAAKAAKPASQPNPAPAAPAQVAASQAEPDYLTELFGTPAEQEAAQAKFTANAEAKRRDVARVRDALAAELKRAQAEHDDWAGRTYKANRTQVDLRGDGPSNQAAMSIGAINESRRRNALDALSHEIAAIGKLSNAVATDSGAERFMASMADLMSNAQRAVESGNWSGATVDEMFQSMLLDELKFRGPGGKGNVTSNGLSRAVLAAVKGTETQTPKATPATVAAQVNDILNAAAEPPKGKERLDVLKDAKAGAVTPEEVAAAFPPAEAAEEPAPAGPAPMPAVGGISMSLAQAAHAGTSFSPERRAEQERDSFQAALRDAWDRAARIAGADPAAIARITEVFSDVADGYRARYSATLQARSRVMSAMITGPAKFPVERNRKRMETERKRAEEASEYLARGIKRLIRAARGPIDNSPESELERVRLNLSQREEAQEQMKAANAALRKGDDAALEDLGFTAEQIAGLKKGNSFGDKGFPAYKLTNNNAEIRRLRERLKDAEARVAAAQSGPVETEREGVRVVEDATDDRLRLVFDAKPSEAVREDLKANGFKWSPKNEAWQRQLTDNARAAARQVLDRHFPAAQESREDDAGNVAMFSRAPGGEAAFRQALLEQSMYEENPIGWFRAKLDAINDLLVAEGYEAVESGNGVEARFWSDAGEEVTPAQMPKKARELAKRFQKVNDQFDAAEMGEPPQFFSMDATPEFEAMPRSDRQKVQDLLRDAIAGRLGMDDGAFSRSDTGPGLTRAQAEPVAAAIREALPGSPPIILHDSVADAPASLRAEIERAGAEGDVEAAYHQGEIHVFPGNIASPERMAFVVGRHEVRHHGLRTILGDRLGTTMLRMWRENPALRQAAQAKIDAGHATSRAQAIEEALADMAPEQVDGLSGFDRIVSAVRDWLRRMADKLGLPGVQWTDRDVAAMVSRAEDVSRSGGEGTAFSRAKTIPASTDTRRYQNLRWEQATEDMQTADLGNGWTAAIMQNEDGTATYTTLMPNGADFGEARTYAHVGEARLAAPGVLARQIVDDGTQPGDPTDHIWPKGTAMFSRAPANAADARGQMADALRGLRDAKLPAGYILNDFLDSPGTLSFWHKSVGTMNNLAERNPLFKPVYDSATKFLNAVSSYATEAADLAPDLLPKLEGLRDIGRAPLSAKDTKAIAAPIFEGTLSWTRGEDGAPVRDDNPQTAGIVWTDAELRDRFGLDAKQIGLYREFRRATDKSLTDLAVSDMLRYAGKDGRAVADRVMAAGDARRAADILAEHLTRVMDDQPDRAGVIADTISTIGDKADRVQNLISRGYAPLSRFGRYVVDVVDGDQRVFFNLYETQFEANRAARQMAQAYPGATVSQGTTSQQAYQMFAGISPETMELFGDLLGLEANGNDAASQAFQQYLKLAKSTRSAMKRLIERKGVAGYSEDAGRVLSGFVYSNARQTAKNLHLGELGESVAAIRDEKGEGELLDAAERLRQYVTNPQEEAQRIKSLLFAQFLGGSLAAGMVNLSQTVMVTFPWLTQYGGIKKAADQMRRGLADAVKWETAKGKPTTGDTKLDAALKAAEEDGTVSPQEVHALISQAGGSGALRAGDGTAAGNAYAKGQNFLSKTMLAWGRPFALAEQFNRRATFIAAYRTAQEQGMADPEGFARRAVTETQFAYTKANRPQWARGAVGSLLFTFKTFSISYVELLSRMAKSGPEGRRAAAVGLATLFLMSGLNGLPGSDDLDDLIDGLMQRLGYNWSTKREKRQIIANIIGEGGAKFAMSGLSGLPGVPIDVAGRLGLGNLIPGTGLLTKKADHGQDVAELFGAAGSFGTQVLTAAGQAAEGNAKEAAKALLPVALQNMAKAYDMAGTGMYRDQKGRKVLDVDGYDAAFKAIGFQPNDVATVQRTTREVQGEIALAKLRETEIADKWARGIFDKDADAVDEARRELARWNENNPASRIAIQPAQLLKRLREMRMSKADRLAKTAPREMRAEVRRELEAIQ